MTRVIHTGDTHLGYRQYHQPARRQDFLDAFRRVVEDAVDAEVDAVVHAGDLFHDRRPDLPDLLGTLSVLRELDDADVPFLAVVGNHETKREAQWLDLFESLGLATRLTDEPTVVGDTAFYGLDFVPRSQRDDLAYEFAPHDADHAVLVAHGLFTPFEFGEWDASEVLSEATVDFDAMLLGDNHDPGKKEIEGAWVTYCGSTERASAEERADRGYNIVTFEGDVSITRRGIPTRDFVFVDVELREGEGVDRVSERVRQHDLEDAVVIVSIEGDGEPVAPAHVEEFIDEQGALVARVTDHREATEETDVEVTFADPDEAVRERVRELGLSPAARDLDETIRASKVADSNVTETVEDRVRDLLDEEDATAFESVSAGESEVETETAAEKIAGEDGDAADVEATDSDDGAGRPTGEAEGTGTTTEGDDGAGSGGDGDGGAEPVADGSESAGTGDESEQSAAAQDADTEGDGQASMEEFL